MAQQLLNRPNIVTIFEQMGRERTSESMTEPREQPIRRLRVVICLLQSRHSRPRTGSPARRDKGILPGNALSRNGLDGILHARHAEAEA